MPRCSPKKKNAPDARASPIPLGLPRSSPPTSLAPDSPEKNRLQPPRSPPPPTPSPPTTSPPTPSFPTASPPPPLPRAFPQHASRRRDPFPTAVLPFRGGPPPSSSLPAAAKPAPAVLLPTGRRQAPPPLLRVQLRRPQVTRLQMNQAEVSGLLCVGLYDTNGGEEEYATGYPKNNQDLANETAKFDLVMATTTMCSDHNNSNACSDGYQHTGMMAEIQAVEEVGFGSDQHSEGVVADSEDENMSSSHETSSTTDHDIPGYVDQYQNIYNALDEMVDKEGPVMLRPDFVMCNTTLHLHPHLTFSSDGFKIEYLDRDSCEDDEMIALYWNISDIICIDCKWTQSAESAFMTLLVETSAETRNAGLVRIELCLTDTQWPQKQHYIWHLASRYQEIWKSDDFAPENQSIEPSLFFPKQYFSWTNNFEDVIYPKGDPDAISVSSRDVELLLPETFVNDTIIDFYIKYLSTRIETTEKRRYHFFNSFFFRKLADLDKDQGRAPEGRSAFLRVRKWTRKIDVFSKDFLFIPVNFNLHWSLIVICYPGEVDIFQDGETKMSGKVPCILHMDSLKGSHSGLKDIIQSYLWEEWKERHPESPSNSSDKFLNLRFVSLELPQQDNSFDCGLFLLHYVELFLMDAPTIFNPLNVDVSSSFLSDDWFIPAEASLKRSLIRKLIQELVTDPSRNYPRLVCGGNEQLDKRQQRSENAEQEPANEFSQGCSAGGLDSICTIPGTRQQSTSICLNDSEKGLPASGCILDSGGLSVLPVQELQACPQHDDTVVGLPSQDAKNEPRLADCDNQLDLRCASESGETFKGDRCVVKDKDTHEEPLLDSLDTNQKISSQAEAKVYDIMDSKCCSISDNAACQENALERNTNKDDDCCGASKDMDSVMMLDASKHGTGPNSESIKGESDGRRCDLSEDTNSVEIGDMNKDVSDSSLQRNIVKAEYGRCDISEDTGSVMMANDINEDVAEHSFENNVVDYEDTEHEDTHVNPITAEDATKGNVKETSTTNGSDQHVSSELKHGNTDNSMTSGSTVSCDSKEVNTDNVMAGDSTNGTDETYADGEDAHENLVTGEAAPCEDNTTCTDAEMPHVDSSSAKDETVSESTTCDAKRPHPDSTSEDKNVLDSDDKCQQEDGQCSEEKSDRHYKRRKVVSLETGKRHTRSSSMAPSLD